MKKSNRTLVVLTAASLLWVFVAVVALAAHPPVPLGTATSFAVLAGSTITNTGPTTINGDVGLHPGTDVTGFGTVTHNGALHVNNGVAAQAKSDLVTAYNNAAGRSSVTRLNSPELGNRILTDGTYDSQAGTFQLTGTLTLNGQGNSGAVFIFHTTSTLITASNAVVSLINGAQACNVFWKVGSSATLGSSTRFVGTIMALTSIGMNTSATLQGRALARNGAVTMQSNVITRPSCVTPSPSPSPSPTGGNGSPSPTPTPTNGNGGSPTPSPTNSGNGGVGGGSPTAPPGDGTGIGGGVVNPGAGAGRAGSGAGSGRGNGSGARIPFTGIILPAESFVIGMAFLFGGMIYVFVANPSTRFALAMVSYRPKRKREVKRHIMRSLVRKIPRSIRDSFRI